MTTPNKAEVKVSQQDKVALWVTYLNIALYAMCYQLQRPVKPFLVKRLSEDSSDIRETYGNLQSFFSAIQTVGSPLVGILLDRLGIRYASAMVFLASAVSYGILAVATDMNLLFYSKIPAALQHAFLVAQATAATSAKDDATRAQALARMTTAYTIGATAGPALGGFLAERGDLYAGARLAVVGSLASVVLSLFFLPKVVRSSHDRTGKTPVKRFFYKEVKHTLSLALRSSLWPLLIVKVVGGFATSMHSTALPLVLTEELKFDAAALGLNMSITMFSVAAFGAVTMSPLTKMLGPARLAQAGLMIRSILGLIIAAIVAWQGTRSVRLSLLMATSVSHSLVSYGLSTALTTQTTGAVSADEQGTLLGLEHCLFSLARVYSPSAGTKLLAWGGLSNVEQVCAIVDLTLILVLTWTASSKLKNKSP
jgi:predicted MFS family arabinose efflux permease